jgi:hypothetical protein
MAGGKASTFNNDLLKLIFNGTPISGIADNAASAPLTSLYLSLHLSDPGTGGSQNTAEATYPGYVRQAVSRTSAGFTVSGASAILTTVIVFPACATWGSSETETWAAVGTVSTAVSPQLTTGTTFTES